MQITPTALAPGKAGAKTGHPCRACALPHKILETVDSKLRMGEKTRHVHIWLLKTFPVEAARVSYDILASHHRRHVKLIDRAAGRLSDAQRMRRERIDLSKAVLAGTVDPQAYFSPASIAQDLAKTSKRLDFRGRRSLPRWRAQCIGRIVKQLVEIARTEGSFGWLDRHCRGLGHRQLAGSPRPPRQRAGDPSRRPSGICPSAPRPARP